MDTDLRIEKLGLENQQIKKALIELDLKHKTMVIQLRNLYTDND